MTSNYYCAGEHCRKTTRRLTVRMEKRTYYYCVNCGRRLELRDEDHAAHPHTHTRRAG